MMETLMCELREIKKLLKDIKSNQEQFLRYQKAVESCTTSKIEQVDKITVRW